MNPWDLSAADPRYWPGRFGGRVRGMTETPEAPETNIEQVDGDVEVTHVDIPAEPAAAPDAPPEDDPDDDPEDE